jgi:hypothetical protein
MALHATRPDGRTCLMIAATGLLACSVGVARADTSEWQHTVLFYGMGAAIDGDAQVGDLKVPVDVSMSDVFDALEFGAMAAYRADNGTWSFTVDTTFMGLGGSSESERGLVKGDLDLDQFTLMGTVGRHWTEHLDALFSLSYFDLSTDLKLTTTAPVGGAVTVRTASVDASWVDPMIGLHYGLPFRDDWRFNLRGDVGGFGIGSDFSYQLLATVRWQSSGQLGAVFGYRVIGFDYEDGQKGSRNYQRFDLTQQGPMLGVTYDF